MFAATHPKSNDKLQKDIDKVRTSAAEHRFVFFLSPVAAGDMPTPGVTVVQLNHPGNGRAPLSGPLTSACSRRRAGW